VSAMKIVVGLGNPGPEYEHTRHNLGFMLIDLLAQRGGIRVSRSQDGAIVGQGSLVGVPVVLAKPQTYMNLSGDAVKPLAARYEVAPADVIVAVDDLALPFGRIRVRAQGSAGGHNGLKSIIARLATHGFPRVRMGIAPDHPIQDTARFVLQPFPRGAREEVDNMLWGAADAVESVLTDGVERAMAKYNGKDEG
jgi:peptidyl-tRNA hydrolase, PTH1 family